jgi:hypothetical protein
MFEKDYRGNVTASEKKKKYLEEYRYKYGVESLK